MPGVSGAMIPLDKLGGGGRSVHIDARTTIDARGATQETLVELRREMAARDARLRAELPALVDNRVIDSRTRGRY